MQGKKARGLSAVRLNPPSRSHPPKTITRNVGVAAPSRAGVQNPEFPFVIPTLTGKSFDALSTRPFDIQCRSRKHCDSERTSYGDPQRRKRHMLSLQ